MAVCAGVDKHLHNTNDKHSHKTITAWNAWAGVLLEEIKMIPSLFSQQRCCRSESPKFILVISMLALVLASPLAQATDTDLDGVVDSQDNCINNANNTQLDTDGDGYGNACDGDFDQSGFVDAGDLSIFRSRYMNTDTDADLDGSGDVSGNDLLIVLKNWGC